MDRLRPVAVVLVLLIVLVWVVRRDVRDRERMDSDSVPDTNIGAIQAKRSFVFNAWPPPGYYAALNAGPTRSSIS